MTKHTQRVTQPLENLVLGRAAQSADLMRDINTRIGAMYYTGPAGAIWKMVASQTATRSPLALRNIEKILKANRNKSDGFATEALRLRESIERSAAFESTSTSLFVEAYRDDIETQAQGLMNDRKAMMAEWRSHWGEVDARPANQGSNPMQIVEAAILEEGAERGTILRQARNDFLEMVETNPGQPPVVWLTLGWCLWQITLSDEEPTRFLVKTSQTSAPSFAASLAMRLLADFAAEYGFPQRAFDWLKKAEAADSSAELHAELALASSIFHDSTVTKKHLESALTARPGVIHYILSDPRSVTIGGDLLDVVVRVQFRLKRDARQACSNWAEASKEVAEAIRLSTGNLSVSHDLMEGHKAMLERIDQADLVCAGYLLHFCERSTVELLDAGLNSIATEYEKRCDAVSLARKGIDSLGAARENRVEQAMKVHEGDAEKARGLLKGMESTAQKVESGLTYGLVSGAGLFALYIFAYLLLQNEGIQIGATSPLGAFIIFVSALPIAIAVVVQISYGLRKAKADSDASVMVKNSRTVYNQAVLKADEVYREQLHDRRKALAQAEAELKKADTSLKYLNSYKSNRAPLTREKAA